VERHQQHAGCDTDPVGAGGDRRGGGQDRGKIAVLDEVVLGQPDIVIAVVLAPGDLIKDFAIQPVGGLAPLGVAEVIPKAAMLLNDDSGTAISRNVRSVSQVTQWLDDFADDY
jgi:hypothetical protein